MKIYNALLLLITITVGNAYSQKGFTYNNSLYGVEALFPTEPKIENTTKPSSDYITVESNILYTTSSTGLNYMLIINKGEKPDWVKAYKNYGNVVVRSTYQVEKYKVTEFDLYAWEGCTRFKVVQFKDLSFQLRVYYKNCAVDDAVLPFFNSFKLNGISFPNPNIDNMLFTQYNFNNQQTKNLAQNNLAKRTVDVKPDNFAIKEEPAKSADIDINIPVTLAHNDKTFAVIIGNEDYANEIHVKYAKNDAGIFYQYVLKTLGVPQEQVHYVENATYGKMLGEIDWLRKVAKVFKGESKLIFYYAGHGVPDESSKSAYLLPVDGIASQTRSSLSVEELYASLGEFPVKQATVFLDACFSGAAREGMLASGRGVRITPITNRPKGNVVIFSAVMADQTAHPYDEKTHGLFSYFLMKKLQETKGEVTLKELGDYILKEVSQHAIIKGKEQTPCVNVSIDIQNSWQNWTF